MDNSQQGNGISKGSENDIAEHVNVGAFVFQLSTATLVDNFGAPVSLGYQAGIVLRALATTPGETVGKEDLMTAAWGGIHVTENNLVQCIRQIRRAIRDPNGQIIRTVPKVGYVLVQDSDSLTALTGRPRRLGDRGGLPRLAALAAGAGLLVYLGLASAGLLPGWKTAGEATFAVAREGSTAAEARTPSIVVLPFDSVSDDDRWERLGHGLAMGISGELARHPNLNVNAGGTVFIAGGNPLEVADDHFVRLVLDGTLLAQGDTIQVTARLSDATDKKILWTQTWRGSASDVFEWQDDILSRVMSSISSVWTGALSEEILERARRRPTESLEAFELFLIGSSEKHQFTKEGLTLALTYLQRATEIDPEFARAWVAIDLASVYLSDFASSREERDAIYASSLDARRRAYAADPEDPQVLMRYAGLMAENGDVEEAKSMHLQAVEAAPSDADILSQAAFTAAWRGITGELPVVWAERAISLNTTPPPWYDAALGMALFHAGRYEDASASLAKAAEMSDVTMIRASAEALMGNVEVASKIAADLKERAPNMVARDLVPFDAELTIESWQKFLDGARLAGLKIEADQM